MSDWTPPPPPPPGEPYRIVVHDGPPATVVVVERAPAGVRLGWEDEPPGENRCGVGIPMDRLHAVIDALTAMLGRPAP